MRKFLVAFLALLMAVALMLTGCDVTRTSYSVEYYYDGVIDDSKTFKVEGNVGEVIASVPDEAGDQYEPDLNTPSSLPFTLTANPDDNIIKIYYTTMLEVPTDFPIGMGNTLNNLANEGYAVEQGDWVYYVYCSGLYTTSFDGVYKMRLDGSEKTKLYDGYCNSLNIIGDWLYFADISNGKVMRMKTDGTSCAAVCEGADPTYVDGWIYYSFYDLSDATYTFCKVSPDGTENTQIYENAYCSLVADGWAYFYDYAKSELYKTKLDGNSKTVVRGEVKNFRHLVIDGDWLYYSEALGELEMTVDNHQIYKMRLDGSQHTAVKKTTYSNGDFGIYNSKLYYYSCDSNTEEGSWYQANLDGSGATALDSRFSGSYINFAGGWMIAGSGVLSMLRLDGSDFYKEQHSE